MTAHARAGEKSTAQPTAHRTLVAHAVAKSLCDNGIDRVFLVTGADLWLWHALRDAGIGLYLARSESAAVVMADGYARATGRPAVVYGQWGPGAANVAAALADAQWARSPVVALTSTVPTTMENRFDYQELDQPPMFTSVTKWQARANRPERVGDLLARAIAVAGSGSPGPVHLDVPTDLFNEPVAVADSYAPTCTILPPAPSATAVSAVAERLAGARRPLILAGNGVLLAEGAAELIALAERAGTPVMTSMGGKGSIPEDHPLAAGVVGRYSRKVCNKLAAEADFVLAVGTDLGALVTDSFRIPAAGADIVQVDVEPERLGATMPVSLGVVADAREFAHALTAALPESPPAGAQAEWRARVGDEVAAWHKRFAEIAAMPADGHVRPEAVVDVLAELADPHDIVVADTGFMGAWGGVLYPLREPGRTFLHAAGTLGWGFPAVLGAQLALDGDRRAIGLVGDGGFGYHIGDIETAVRLEIPAIVLVLNNAGLAYEVIGFEYVCGDVVREVCDFADIDHGRVAESFGAFGARVDSTEGLREALREALAQRRPAVIDVVVSQNRFAPVTTFETFVERDL